MTLQAIIERDGTACVWCGREPWRTDMTAEHVYPRSRGGRSSAENLTIACRSCNRRRGTRPVVAFVRDQLQDGAHPRAEVLTAALDRLAASDRRDLAAYAQRQRALLSRVLAERAPA
jgi:5-methylcytosine-specific restriction endonuclease McrA